MFPPDLANASETPVRHLKLAFSNPSFLGGRQNRCFHKYGHAGRLGETPYCLHTPVTEDSTTLPPDRLVARLLVVRGLAALGLTASLWPSRHGCTLWNGVPFSVARGIIAALKPDHHVKVAALGPRAVGDSVPFAGPHHYHYPNMNAVTVGRPTLLRVGSGGRLSGFVDPRLLSPATAALIDPVLAPYDNSTLGVGDLDFDSTLVGVPLVGHVDTGFRRRVNSFESLHRFSRPRAVGDSVPFAGPHHYHYPNMNAVTVGRPTLLRVGSGGRLSGFVDPRLLSPATAALIDPVLAPYDNSTLGVGDLDFDSTLVGVPLVGHVDTGFRRRVNSFESLHRFSLSRTYHRGFSTNAPAHSMMASNLLGPDGQPLPLAGPGVAAANFCKQTDPVVAYRGSVLSSTTASSNQDELVQAYEYGRRNHPRIGGTNLLSMTGSGAGGGAGLVPPRNHMAPDQTPTMLYPPMKARGVSEVEVSEGSGSSEATDSSGIRQFTQQPPQPDEARHAACEIPLACENKQLGSYRPGREPGFQYGPIRAAAAGASRRPGQPLCQANFDMHSELTDTYASVDYNATPYVLANAAFAAGASMNRRDGRQICAPNTAATSRARQPLPAVPASSMLDFPDDVSSAYVPAYAGQSGRYYAAHPTAFNRTAPISGLQNPAGVSGVRYQGTGHYGKSCVDAGENLGSHLDTRTLVNRGPRTKPVNARPDPTRIGPDNSDISCTNVNSTNGPPDSEENVYTSELLLFRADSALFLIHLYLYCHCVVIVYQPTNQPNNHSVFSVLVSCENKAFVQTDTSLFSSYPSGTTTDPPMPTTTLWKLRVLRPHHPKEHEGWDSDRLPKSTQGKSRSGVRVRTTDPSTSNVAPQPLGFLGLLDHFSLNLSVFPCGGLKACAPHGLIGIKLCAPEGTVVLNCGCPPVTDGHVT
ncbi:hypothetical protein T265_05647 [Opisthorchis viverrini]|uniref:Uncharacterized protein n=1 Tax=Opisthorchis viverrini TaxID=6198 RepID=A0A074ZIU2_OPIVI|nr:hypothetical protein T265_05647 [Opisthorchis viverrini]KER27243.1 hypothetical protein T265_05647 [Opisthorchis viverrini]